MEFRGDFARTREGCLYVKKKPIYIIECTEEVDSPMAYVTVYDVQNKGKQLLGEDSKVIPTKATGLVTVESPKILNSTFLGSLASKFNSAKDKQREVEVPPLFMAEVVEGVDTFTKERSMGFYEREKDSFAQRDGKAYVKHGELTGVFISLNNIVWHKDYFAVGSILEEYEARKGIFLGL